MENEKTKLKPNPYLKKSTLGNVRKQTCELICDLNQISHMTSQMKKATKKINMRCSESLLHLRLKDAVMKVGTKLLTQSDLGDDIETMSHSTHKGMHERELIEGL